MAVAPDFPASIMSPQYPLAETPEDAVIRSTMEDGTEKTRPRFTRNRFTFELTWESMEQGQKEIFENFFRTITKGGALAFNWIHPATKKKYLVRFTEPPKFTLRMTRYWQVSAKFKEV